MKAERAYHFTTSAQPDMTTTLNSLKLQAAALGLTTEYVKTFGKLSAKTTWVTAIDAYIPTPEPTLETEEPTPLLTKPEDVAQAIHCEPTPVISNMVEPAVSVVTQEPASAQPNEATPMLLLIVAVVVILQAVVSLVKPLLIWLWQRWVQPHISRATTLVDIKLCQPISSMLLTL
jgi:hypothetical protein